MKKLLFFSLVCVILASFSLAEVKQGYTDSIGNKEFNRKLSAERAEAIYEYMVNAEIDPKRLNAKGFGEDKPVASNITKRGRARNRKVKIVIFSKKDKKVAEAETRRTKKTGLFSWLKNRTKKTEQEREIEKATTKSEPKKEPKIIITIAVSKANVRSGPGTSYDKVAQIYKGREIGLFERRGKWLLIGYGKEWLESGWIHMKLFSPITLSKLLKQEGFLPPLGCTEKEVLSKYGSPADVANFKGEKVYGYGRLFGRGTRTYGGKTIHFQYGVCTGYKRIFSGDWNKSDSYSFLADVVPAELFGKKYKYSEKNLGDLQYQKEIHFSSHSDIWIITAFAWPVREYDPQKGYYWRNPSLKEYKVLAVAQGVSGFFKKQ